MDSLGVRLALGDDGRCLGLRRVSGRRRALRCDRLQQAERFAECADGFQGRVGIHEVLPLSPTIKELVAKGASAVALEEQAKKEGMITMLEDGIFKAIQGITTLEEVEKVLGA